MYLLLIKPAVISLCTFSSRAGGHGKRRATNSTRRGRLSERRREPEECRMHASPQQPTAGSRHGLVSQTPAFAPSRDPRGHSSPGARCHTQDQHLPSLSQGSGTNKTRGENSQFFQACSSPTLSRGMEAAQPAHGEARAPYPARDDNVTPTKQPPAPCSVLLSYVPGARGRLLSYGFSTPASPTSLLLRVHKNASKCCSTRQELGGVKPRVSPNVLACSEVILY